MYVSVPGTRTHQNRPDHKQNRKQTQQTNGVAFKNRSTRNNVWSVFFIATPKSRFAYIGPRSTTHLSGPHTKYPTLIPCIFIYPHKRNVDALLKVGVIIKGVVFRTLCWVVARIALATGYYYCCWSIHRVRQQLIDDGIIRCRDILENVTSCSPGINR